MKKNIIRNICLTLIICLLLSCSDTLGSRVSAAEIDELTARQEEVQSKIDELSGELGALKNQQSNVEKEFKWLKDRSAEQKEQFKKLQEEKEKSIKVQQTMLTNLQVATKNFEDKKIQYADRVQSMFMLQSKSWLELLLESESLQSFFSTVRFMKTITEADEEALDELLKKEQEVNKLLEDTNKEIRNLESHMTEVDAELQKIEADKSYVSSRLSEIGWTIEDAHGKLADAQNADQEINAELAAAYERLEAERKAAEERERKAAEEAAAQAAREEAANSSSNDSSDSSSSNDSSDSSTSDEISSPSSSEGYAWPCPGGYTITSYYGPRDMFGRSFHYGIDIGASYGAPAVASKAGTVSYAGWNGGYGNFILIDHGDGTATAYGHLSGYNCSVGESVSQNQTIGFIGSTGDSTGPHLHFEIRIGGSAVDPLGYF